MKFYENRLLASILLKYHTLFFSKIGKDVAKFVVCCSWDWRFLGLTWAQYMKFRYLLHMRPAKARVGACAFTQSRQRPHCQQSKACASTKK